VKLAVVMMVRDEADIVATTIAHHRSSGAAEVLVLDNGSTDGTVEVLRRLADADPAVRWTIDDGPYDQGGMTTGLAREAVARGAEWVLPVDADELWWTPGGSLADVLGRSAAGGLVCPVDSFAQDRSRPHRHLASLLSMRWRVPARVPEPEARGPVGVGSASFLEMTYPPKCVSRASAELVIHPGNHHVDHQPGPTADTHDIVVLHAPVRDRDRVRLRAMVGQRMALVHEDPQVSWHNRRFGPDAPDEVVEAEWRSCSAADGMLDLPNGARVAVVPDRRLCRAAGRHIRWLDRVVGPVRGRWGRL
jgi:hypothetical protein